MTAEVLKKKIDGLMFGLHSTNPGDINALPEILNELVAMASPDIITLTWDNDQGRVVPTAEEKAVLAEKVAAGTIINTPIRYEYPVASGEYVYCGVDLIVENLKYIYLYVYKGGPARQEVSYAL